MRSGTGREGLGDEPEAAPGEGSLAGCETAEEHKEGEERMKQRTITGLLLTALLAVLLWLPGWCMAIAVQICVSFAVH